MSKYKNSGLRKGKDKIWTSYDDNQQSAVMDDLQRIQSLFPLDNLFEDEEKSHLSKFANGKLATSSKLQRVLSGKSKITPKEIYQFKNGIDLQRFVMEIDVTLTVGMQSEKRILLLFEDILLIAKVKSLEAYKLKNRIRVSELWIGDCMDDVCEVTLHRDTSFVLGWPVTNVVVSFRTPQLKNLWYCKLKHLISAAKRKEAKTTIINVNFNSSSLFKQQTKQLNVHSDDTACDCVRKILSSFSLNGEDFRDYQLWVETSFEPIPYPLIGHEFPFAIKMNCIRSLLNCHAVNCCFILRPKKKLLNTKLTDTHRKGSSKSRLIMNRMFRRSSSKSDIVETPPSGCLFARPLSSLCQNNQLPKPILEILIQLRRKGPYTCGIFRKSSNTRACKELRQKLDCNQYCNISNYNVLLLTCVLKDFLRSLPDCLMSCNLYEEWIQLAQMIPQIEISSVKKIVNKLPAPNLLLLEHLMCILWSIAQRSDENQMTPINLAVCIGPTLLWSNRFSLSPESSKKISNLIQFFITQCPLIFGEKMFYLCDIYRRDSGAEESDSYGLSSTESLEKMSTSPKFSKQTKISLSNLSRDSGLTLSDSQLYIPEEDVTTKHLETTRSRVTIYEKTTATTTCKPQNKTYRKERQKRRLARPRQWYNPGTAWDPDDISPMSTLRKSNSEKNVNVQAQMKDGPGPPNVEFQNRVFRSVSVFHLLNEPEKNSFWHRTQSTPQLDDASLDYNTVSDDDSTPHVSRSNSKSNKRSTSLERSLHEMESKEQEIYFAAPIHILPPPLPPKPQFRHEKNVTTLYVDNSAKVVLTVRCNQSQESYV